MSQQQALAVGMHVEVVEYDLAALAGTCVMRSRYRGLAELVVDGTDDVVVGAATRTSEGS